MKSRNSPKKQETTFVMDVAPGAVGLVIGRGGARIKSIRRESGCNLWVDQDVPDDHPRKLFFMGPPAAVAAAVARVEDLLSTATPPPAGDESAVGNDILDCPPALVGLLIGRQGGTIHKIQQISGATVSINQCVRPGLPRRVVVSGDAAAVRGARTLITEVLTCKTLQGEVCTPRGEGSDNETETGDNETDMHLLIAYLMTPSPGVKSISDSPPHIPAAVPSERVASSGGSSPWGSSSFTEGSFVGIDSRSLDEGTGNKL